MEDYCVICAEPLEWVAYGHCGHKDACSKCVTRLRFVLDDKRCVICQQMLQQVFVTKFLGSFTKTLPAVELAKLGEKDSQIRTSHLRSIDAFFDEKSHFDEIRRLCSYTHPKLEEADSTPGSEEVPTHFRNLLQLRKAVQQYLHLQFCNICLEGRKVFISEQLLYNAKDLARHQQSGDVEGVMAESGFKGHPHCKFCNKRFFGENELFFHMQQAHEQCHICKRQQPDRFVYYKDYNELEEHFRREHFLCGDSQCLDQKFVVFASEQELKQHNAREHAGSMTRAERRQAMTIPIDISYSHRPEAAPTVPRGRSRGGVQFREADPHHLATALQASMASAQQERVNSNQAASTANAGGARLAESDFPSMAGDSSGSGIGLGFSAFAQARGQAPRPEDFPALPTLTKSQKRREKAKEKEREEEAKSLAQRIGRQGQVQVLSSGRPPGSAVPPARASEAFPALGSASAKAKTSRGPSPNPQWHQSSTESSGGPRLEDFPSLPQAPQRNPTQPPVFPSLSTRANGSSSTSTAAPSATAASARRDDFPALGNFPALQGAAAPPKAGGGQLREGPGQQQPRGMSTQPERGMSEALKAANKVLLEKVKKQLSQAKFGEFRQSVGSFMRDEMDAQQYRATVDSLGLGHLIPEMATLLPDPTKRAELLSVHEASASSSKKYVPPEAAAAALKAARSQGSWGCTACTLINDPKAATCEACGSKRPLQSLGTLTRQKTGEKAKDTGLESKAKPGGPKKVPKFERLRVTSGGQDTAFRDEVDRRTRPQNAWTHKHSLGQTAASTSSAWPQSGSQPGWGK